MMRIRVYLANVSFCVLAFQSFSRPLLADIPHSPVNAEKRMGSATTIEDIGPEKGEKLKAPAKWNHLVEHRAVYTPVSGWFQTQNLVELGHSLSEYSKISYVQFFNTNLYNAETQKSILNNVGFTWQDGFFRLKVKNLWESEDKSLSFNLQERVYIPVASTNDGFPSRAAQGMIFVVRNYFSLSKKLYSFLEMDFAIVPTFHIYRKDGFDAGEKRIANPYYETQFNHSSEFKVAKNLLFTFPISFKMTRYRDYHEDADRNASWSYHLSTFPELAWSYSDKHTVGAAFLSDNMVKSKGSEFQLIHALREGVIQVFWSKKF